MNKLRDYFDYNYKPTLQGEMITQLLNETSILEAEDIFKKMGKIALMFILNYWRTLGI